MLMESLDHRDMLEFQKSDMEIISLWLRSRVLTKKMIGN